jgi:hypothetical protein
VGEQHLVDEAVGEQAALRIELDLVEHLERPLPHPLHIRPDLVGAEDRQLAPDLSGLLDRVIELAEVPPERLSSADLADQPELFEVGDVAEVPDQRTEDRRVDPVELLVREWLDQLQGVASSLSEPLCDRGLLLAAGGATTLLFRCGNLLGDL